MNPEDPHKPLRDDVRLLGTLLGQTLRRQEGDVLFRRVERVRALAKRARRADAGASPNAFDALAARRASARRRCVPSSVERGVFP